MNNIIEVNILETWIFLARDTRFRLCQIEEIINHILLEIWIILLSIDGFFQWRSQSIIFELKDFLLYV